MKKRLKEMEDEAAALREMQAKVEKEMGAVQGPLLPSLFRNLCHNRFSFLSLFFFSLFLFIPLLGFGLFAAMVSVEGCVNEEIEATDVLMYIFDKLRRWSSFKVGFAIASHGHGQAWS